jgi:hypothetical protein
MSAIILFYYQASVSLPRDLRIGMLSYPLLQVLALHLTMVAAHLLGRFYFKYQDKLNWEV